MFYPGNPEVLKKTVRKFIDDAKEFDLPNLKALICPHAGYQYSGPIAGFSYRQLKKIQKKPSAFFLIGPSHYAYIDVSVGNFEAYETPIGPIKVNQKICGELIKSGLPFIPETHTNEHCLEVQLPFLKSVCPEAEIVPILCGSISPDELVGKLDHYFQNPDCFFIISSDFSHYLSYEDAILRDKHSLKIIESANIANENQIDACGVIGIRMIMRLAKKYGYKIKLLDYRNSGDTAGDKKGVVGYGALGVCR